VQVVSPEQVLWEGDADRVITRTVGGGDIAFMTGHVPFMGALDIGVTEILQADGTMQYVAVHGGFVEVSEDRVSLLSDSAELAADIDVPRAQADLERVRASLDAEEIEEAREALMRAEIRLRAAEAHANR
jgi:F-type H+-transporting ATPase subunit epsilon